VYEREPAQTQQAEAGIGEDVAHRNLALGQILVMVKAARDRNGDVDSGQEA
jgi:hypothetical protein